MNWFRIIRSRMPEEQELISHHGQFYTTRIAAIANLNKTYLEVGTRSGASLAPITCSAIAIDPKFQISANVIASKKACHFFQITSDEFFARHDPRAILKSAVDTAFLDGMHLYEYLLRDFINVEKYCSRESTIFLHDCLPPTFEMTNRDGNGARRHYKNYWTGDVWKVIPILKKVRPDLVMTFFDCPPTGLAAITNLDPASDVLSRRYGELVSDWQQGPDDFERLRSFIDSVQITRSNPSPVGVGDE